MTADQLQEAAATRDAASAVLVFIATLAATGTCLAFIEDRAAIAAAALAVAAIAARLSNLALSQELDRETTRAVLAADWCCAAREALRQTLVARRARALRWRDVAFVGLVHAALQWDESQAA